MLQQVRAEQVAAGQRADRRREREHEDDERGGEVRGARAEPRAVHCAVERCRDQGGDDREPVPLPEQGHGAHRALTYTTVKTTIHTTSTKCQYRPTLRSRCDGLRLKSPAIDSASTMPSAMSPTVTCSPWKPVSVKNVVANRLLVRLMPPWYRARYSRAWPTMKTPPSAIVSASQTLALPWALASSDFSD